MPCNVCGADVINPMGTSHQNSRRHQDALGLHSSAAAAPRRSVARPVQRRPAAQADYFDQIFSQQSEQPFPQQPQPVRRAPVKKPKAAPVRRPKAPVQQVQQYYDEDEEGEDDQDEQPMF
jgi:hypothetical protein